MKKQEQIIRFQWETQLQYDYRVETGKVIKNAGVILGNLEKVQKQDPKEIIIINEFNKLNNRLNNLIVPELYTEIHDYLTKCMNNYYKASEKLVNGLKTKDSALAIQAGQLIKKGTCFMEISKLEIFEIVQQQEENLNKK